MQIARARVRQAELNLSYTEVNAPIGGITGRALQSVGSLVAPNADSALLTTLTRSDPIWVRFSLSEAEFSRMRGNEAIEVKVELADGKEYPQPGKLNFAGSTVDAATGTVQMRAELPNPKLELLPGQYVRVRVQAGTQQAFVVPQTAVAQNETGRFVWVADGGKARASARSAPAIGSARDWVVLDGLKPGDRVIVDNLVRLRPGVADRAEMSKFFIHRPVFAGVIAIVIVLAGLLAAKLLRGRAVPRDRAADGADHHLLPGRERRDARRAPSPRRSRSSSRASRSCSYFSSTSSSNGNLQITATFEPGTNVDAAVFKVNNRVQLALPRLPDEVRRNGVIVQKRSFDILLVVSLVSPGNQRDTLFLSNYASINLVDELKRLPGVADVTIFGARDYSMRVWLNPEKMARLGRHHRRTSPPRCARRTRSTPPAASAPSRRRRARTSSTP